MKIGNSLCNSPRSKGPEKLMLDMNELGYALPKDVEDGLRTYPLDYRRYGCRTNYHKHLRGKLAECLHLKPENFIITHGSDDALKNIIETCLSEGDEVITVEPSYQYHWMWLEQKKIKRTSYNNIANTDELANLKVPLSTKMLYFCNPNNPTGRIIDRSVVEKICGNNPHCLVLVDEAYAEYHSDAEVLSQQLNKAALEQTGSSLEDCVNGFIESNLSPRWMSDSVSASWFNEEEDGDIMKLPWWSVASLKLPNLVVSRTFSKAYGIAGLRLGYIVDAGNEERCRLLDKNYSQKALSEIALLAGNLVMENRLAYADVIRKNFFCQKVFVEFLKQKFYKGLKTTEYDFLKTRSFADPVQDEDELKYFVGEGPYVLFSVPKDLSTDNVSSTPRVGFLEHMKKAEGIHFRDQHHNIAGTVRVNMCNVEDLNRVIMAMAKLIPKNRR